MKRKQLVKEQGRYVERYVDQGPMRALPNHGRTARRVTGTPVGSARMNPATGQGR